MAVVWGEGLVVEGMTRNFTWTRSSSFFGTNDVKFDGEDIGVSENLLFLVCWLVLKYNKI